MPSNPQELSPQQMQEMYSGFAQQFLGDPQQRVQALLSSGQMSQAQFNQLSSLVPRLRGLFGVR